MDGKVLSFFFFKNQKYLQIFIFTIWSVKLIQCYYEIFAYFSCVIVIEMKTTWSVTAIPRIHSSIFNKGNAILRRNYPAFVIFECFWMLLLFYSIYTETTEPPSASPFADVLLWARDCRKHYDPNLLCLHNPIKCHWSWKK